MWSYRWRYGWTFPWFVSWRKKFPNSCPTHLCRRRRILQIRQRRIVMLYFIVFCTLRNNTLFVVIISQLIILLYHFSDLNIHFSDSTWSLDALSTISFPFVSLIICSLSSMFWEVGVTSTISTLNWDEVSVLKRKNQFWFNLSKLNFYEKNNRQNDRSFTIFSLKYGMNLQ